MVSVATLEYATKTCTNGQPQYSVTPVVESIIMLCALHMCTVYPDIPSPTYST